MGLSVLLASGALLLTFAFSISGVIVAKRFPRFLSRVIGGSSLNNGCISMPNMRQLYVDQVRARAMFEENIKPEALRHWPSPLPEAISQALQATP